MKFLIVVDMQEDFINGVFGSDATKAIVPYVAKQIRSDEYDCVIFTRDWHGILDEESDVEKYLLPPHCIANTKGAELVKDIIPNNYHALIINKNTFGAVKLEDIIIDNISWDYELISEIHIVGLYTDTCIISNALAIRMWFPAARIIVHEQGCAGTTPEKHLAALEVMKSNLIEVDYNV